MRYQDSVLGLLLALGTNAGLAQTNFWQQANGPNGVVISAFAVNNTSGQIFASTRGAGVFYTTDDGESWIPSSAGLTNVNVLAVAINFATQSVFAGTFSGIFRSTNNGASWAPANTGLTNVAVRAFGRNAFGQLLAGTAGGIHRSANNGDNWAPVNSGLTAPDVRCFALHTIGYVFAGTYGGGIFRSTDHGNSWQPANAGLMNNEDVNALAISLNGDIWAATRGHGVFRSTDNGNSWLAFNAGLKNLYIHALAINTSGHIFAGTDGDGVFRSTDRGANWTPINAGLGNFYIWSLAIKTTGYIFAGTDGNGVFRSVQSTTAVQELADDLPRSFALEQNYPNPFWSGATSPASGGGNPSTTFRFSLPRASEVTLKVYDLLGMEVATVLKQKLAPGNHEIKWNAGALPGGIYLYRLQTNGFVETKKLAVLR